jgi:hypothetical protein
MPAISADEIVTSKHKRHFIQFGSARPNNVLAYGGQNAQYLVVEGVGVSETGGVNPIWVHDPRRQGQYRLVGRSITAPDLASATLIMREKHGVIPRQLTKIGCLFNLYEVTGACNDLSDFLSGWSDYVLIYSGCLVTKKDLGKRTSWDADDPMEDAMDLTISDVYPIGSLSFGENAATLVDREVTGISYGSRQSCGSCGPEDDGTMRIYACTKSSGSGSPGLMAELIYTLNGGGTWSSMTINGFGVTEDALAIGVAGSYVIVIGTDAYYYSLINQITGVPGTFSKITAGFVAGKSPKDLVIINPREIYICGNGGYVYKLTSVGSAVTVLTDGSATAENLKKIHGVDENIVAVGENGTILRSVNRGVTWATTTTSPVTAGTDILCIAVLDRNRMWVGTDFGYVYYTLNGGETWTNQPFPGNGAGTVEDIAFATDEVGYISYSTTTPTAGLLATINGGADWSSTLPRVLNFPVFNYARRIAIPQADTTIAANNVALSGLHANGIDGIILLGAAAKV